MGFAPGMWVRHPDSKGYWVPRNPPAGQHCGQDAYVAGLGTRCPRIQRQLAQARQLCRVGDLYDLTADHHAPASVSRSVGAIDLERHPAAAARSVQFGSRVGAEHHHVAVEDEVDRKYDRPAVVDESHPAQMLLSQQLEALALG